LDGRRADPGWPVRDGASPGDSLTVLHPVHGERQPIPGFVRATASWSSVPTAGRPSSASCWRTGCHSCGSISVPAEVALAGDDADRPHGANGLVAITVHRAAATRLQLERVLSDLYMIEGLK
jgi:hypothetical protein